MRETEHIFAEGIADGRIKPMKRDYVVGDALDDFIQGLNDASPIRSAERYWRSLSSETRLPSHRDIDPIKIGPATLPHVALIDVLRDDDTRFRYQLLGGAVIQIFAQDYTNRFIDKLGLGEVFDRISGFYGTVCVGRQTLLLDGAYERRKGSRFQFRRLAMPLADENDQVDTLFCIFEQLQAV